MKTYNIGDKVWWARIETRKTYRICQECLGKKYITVILGDDSQVTIDCAGCSAGYDPPTGEISEYERQVIATEVIISQVTMKVDKVEYLVSWYGSNYCPDEDCLFGTEEEAKSSTKQLEEQKEEEKKKFIWRKEDTRRTWSWNACYHRKEIRRAEKDLAYHRAKLEVAKTKAKGDKNDI